MSSDRRQVHVDREVGRGGSGVVWLGRDEVLGREVALKRLGFNPGGGSPDLERAEREARLAARLNHPHVVAVYDLVQDGDDQWLVMEYVAGETLAALVKREGPLRPDQAGDDHRAGGRRTGRRARRGHRPPRRQAVEHPGDARRTGEAVRLRHRPGAGRRVADPDRPGDRLAGVPRPRGRLRQDRHRGERRVVARGDALPRAGRPSAVRRRRQRARRALPDRARGAAAADERRVAGSGPARDDDSRARRPVVGRQGPRRACRRAVGAGAGRGAASPGARTGLGAHPAAHLRRTARTARAARATAEGRTALARRGGGARRGRRDRLAAHDERRRSEPLGRERVAVGQAVVGVVVGGRRPRRRAPAK